MLNKLSKTQLRQKYKVLRSALTEADISSASIKISNLSLTLPIWDFTYYHIFLPIEKNNEIDTTYLISILQGKDKEVVVPKSNFANNSLMSILMTDNTRFEISDYGIPEPVNGIPLPTENLQVVFVPLLAFDKNGNRVGYGKGFYDRFLSECEEGIVKIGLSFFNPEEEIAEVSSFDISLDYCITPDKIYDFTKI
ncbi:5-formyltetrahydrofolate cyclo-ligase [Flavobacteriaceae bacterium M23B6Z8]